MKKIHIYFFFLLIGPLVLWGDPLDDFRETKSIYEKYSTELGGKQAVKIESLNQKYLEALNTLKERMLSEARLEDAIFVNEEIKLFSEEKLPGSEMSTLPEELKVLIVKYNEALGSIHWEQQKKKASLATRYLDKLKRLQDELTRNGSIENALMVKEERERVETEVDLSIADNGRIKGQQDGGATPQSHQTEKRWEKNSVSIENFENLLQISKRRRLTGKVKYFYNPEVNGLVEDYPKSRRKHSNRDYQFAPFGEFDPKQGKILTCPIKSKTSLTLEVQGVVFMYLVLGKQSSVPDKWIQVGEWNNNAERRSGIVVARYVNNETVKLDGSPIIIFSSFGREGVDIIRKKK